MAALAIKSRQQYLYLQNTCEHKRHYNEQQYKVQRKTFNFYFIFMRKVISQKVSIVNASQLVGLRRPHTAKFYQRSVWFLLFSLTKQVLCAIHFMCGWNAVKRLNGALVGMQMINCCILQCAITMFPIRIVFM